MHDRLIDEYIDEVTKQMGARQRDEVAREMRTHILDSADALAAERKATVDEAIVREVIAKMGPASQVAAMYPTKKTFLEMKGLMDAVKGLGGLVLGLLLVAGILWIAAPDTLNSVPVQIILNIAGALALATVVIFTIFLAMFIYESQLKSTYEARLKRLEKSLNDVTSPIKIFFAIFGTLVWLVMLNLFWSGVPFVSSFGGDVQIIHLLSPDFAGFVMYFNLLGILTIAVQLLYLGLPQKWVPSLLETAISVVTVLLFLWVMAASPFNPELSAGIVTVIKVVLAIIMAGTLFDAAKKLWQTAQLFIHGEYGRRNAA